MSGMSGYRYSVGDIVNNFIILEQTRLNNGKPNQKGYICRCQKCNQELERLEYRLRQGIGCPICDNKIVVKGINDISTTNPSIMIYINNIDDAYKYTKNSSKKIEFKCPDCGHICLKSISKVNERGFSCSKCGDGFSYPNKFIFNMLSQLNIDFVSEYSPDWIKPKRYDFYFEKDGNKYIVEADGGLHYKSCYSNVEDIVSVDNYKDNLAHDNNCEVIRINCSVSDMEYIKNNIEESLLNDILDLSSINWLECEYNARKSLMLSVVKEWNKVHEPIIISNNLKIGKTTVLRYLHRAEDLGLCDFEEYLRKMYKERAKNNGSTRRKILLIEEQKEFNSISDCSKYFLEKNIKIDISQICSCCSNKINSASGYHFKYIY